MAFVSDSREFGDTLLGDVPAWWLQSIMPGRVRVDRVAFIVQRHAAARRLRGGVSRAVSAVAPRLIVVTLLGAPLFAVIGASAMLGFRSARVSTSPCVAIEFFGLSETPVLVAIPLFTFAGFLLSAGSGAARASCGCRRRLLGWLPGGLAIVSLVACALFTAFTGASGVTIIALGALLFPALAQAGYDERFNLGLITASGSLGLLFAPSLPLILTASSRRRRSTTCSSPARCRAS